MCRREYNYKQYGNCPMNVCSCFVMVLKLYIFSAGIPTRKRCGYGMAGGYFTDVMLHSSKNYHHERATEIRQLPKDIEVDCGSVRLRFNAVSFLFK